MHPESPHYGQAGEGDGRVASTTQYAVWIQEIATHTHTHKCFMKDYYICCMVYEQKTNKKQTPTKKQTKQHQQVHSIDNNNNNKLTQQP